MIKIRKPLSGN